MPRIPFREGAGHYDAQVEVEENSFTLRLSLRLGSAKWNGVVIGHEPSRRTPAPAVPHAASPPDAP
mgnify:CR=1 FL=1